MYSRKDLLTAGLILSVAFVIFRASPVYPVGDSRYLMLFTQQLLWNHRLSVDATAIPELQSSTAGQTGVPYQLDQIGDRFYDFYPVGNVILSLPFVAISNACGLWVTDQKGVHDQQREIRLQRTVGALLMAMFAVVIFLTSRLILPFWSSLVVAATTSLGTQVWSTASRCLRSQTWGVFILGFIVWLLVRADGRHKPLRPVILGTCLSWLFFVRPTFASSIVVVATYVLIFHRQSLLPLVLTGAGWLAAFLAYSRFVFGGMPHYYRDQGFQFSAFFEAFARNLVSPSRGLLIYVPVLAFVVYLLVRYGPRRPAMAILAGTAILLHLTIISVFARVGGHCYGPRMTTDLVPWFALLGMLAVQARQDWHQQYPARDSLIRRSAELGLAAFLVLCSIALNGFGAMSWNAMLWNQVPNNISKNPHRVWDWSHPQFLGVALDVRPVRAASASSTPSPSPTPSSANK